VHVARCSLATRSGRPSYSECRCCTGPGHLSFPLSVAAAAGLGIFAAPYFSAQKVIVPELLGEDEHVVAQANALTQGATHTTMLLGPPIAGRAHRHDRRGERPCVVDAATFAVSCVLVAVFVPRRAITAPTEDTSGLLVGLRFIARERLLRIWIPLFVIGDAGWAAFFAAVPLLVFERFDANPRIAGLLFAGFGAGALFGNFVSFRFLTQRVDGLKLIAASVPFQAAPLWLLPLPVGASVLIAATFASGLANGICNPSIHSIWTLRLPPAIRPKAMTASATIWSFGLPLGLVIAGPVLSVYGARPVLVGFAAVRTVTMLGVAAVSTRARRVPVSLTA
jgi:MFS family permease